MKNVKIVFGVLLLPLFALFINACKNDVAIEPTQSEVQNLGKHQEVIKYVAGTYGVKLDDVFVNESDSTILIQGDMTLRLDAVLDAMRGLQTRTHYVCNTSYYKSDYVNVRVSPSLPKEWRTAINDAIINWNSLNATKNKITMYYVSTSTVSNRETDINVQYLNMPTITVGNQSVTPYASCSLPQDGTPRYLKINNRTDIGNLDAGQKKYILTHELGHGIGFFHSNLTSRPLCSMQLNLSSTCNQNDNLSIMRDGLTSGLVSWSNFSACDTEAYARLCLLRK